MLHVHNMCFQNKTFCSFMDGEENMIKKCLVEKERERN